MSDRKHEPTVRHGLATATDQTEEAALEEIERQRRVVDQLATMHSTIRDRARWQGLALLLVVLAASVVASAFAFAGGDTEVQILGIQADRTTWLGWFAVATFVLTLCDLVLDRRGTSGRHEEAVRRLAALKTEYRGPHEEAGAVPQLQRLTAAYQLTMDALPPIPERRFLGLKAAHLRKVQASRYLSDHPGTSAWQAKLAVRRAAREPMPVDSG